jgi:hypothetical protein
VLDVFNEHGVQIMTPAYMADPAEPKIVPTARWYESPARAPASEEEATKPVDTSAQGRAIASAK